MIGASDLLYIQEQVEDIIKFSQDYPFFLDATNLILQWYNAKKKFISLFGDTIIRSKKKIKVSLTEEQQSRRFNDFIEALSENDVLTDELESFLYINKDGFFDNKVILPFPSKNIRTGAKILKSFRKFIADEETIRWAQDTASKFIQENKVEGYLYLSVDPRDFLTLSENNENWWSCHSLDGDYRAGNLSYMVDDTTVIAYLADDKEEHLKCMPDWMEWNSKKWRMLIHTDMKSVVYYNRQYPYSSDGLLEEVYSTLLELLPFNFLPPKFISIDSKKICLSNQLTVGSRVFDSRDIIDTSDYIGYSDLVSSNLYSPIASIKLKDWMNLRDQLLTKDQEETMFKRVFGIKVGEKVICPDCGEEYLERHNSFLCPSCIADRDADEDFYFACSSCGRRLYTEEDVFHLKEECLCKACYKTAIKEGEDNNG